ncbi:hypothetical protein QJS10_CPB04g00998 [Acorus calamus]|uniref:Uncharacterized protein n=1 Tax=Acorus calamus TaxID=4465 RepID=A0AAV9EZR5_ACOCL|nr:hypothetical protein QJS10_CPB04g00998 [Acorus calamus]
MAIKFKKKMKNVLGKRQATSSTSSTSVSKWIPTATELKEVGVKFKDGQRDKHEIKNGFMFNVITGKNGFMFNVIMEEFNCHLFGFTFSLISTSS